MIAYLRQSLQLLNSRSIKSTGIALEVPKTVLLLDTDLLFSGSNITLGKVASVDLTDNVMVSGDRSNVGLRLELNDVLSRNDLISCLT